MSSPAAAAWCGVDLDVTAIGANFAIDSLPDLTNHALTLNAAGNVTQSAAITAKSLLLKGGGNFTLTNTGNSFGSLAGSVGKADVFDSTTMMVGALSSTGAMTLATASGANLVVIGLVTVGNGESALTLVSGGTIADINSEIAALSLSGSSEGNVKLLSSGNMIADLSVFTALGAANFSLNDSISLAVGGTLTTGGNISLTTIGSSHHILIRDKISAANKVTLNSAASISETSNGDIDATTLTGSSLGGVELTSAKNTFADLSTFTTGGNFTLVADNDAALKTIGKIDAGTATIELKTLGSGHTISVDSELEGAKVDLISANAISEDDNGDIDATTLTSSSDGAVALTSNKNTLNDLTAFSTGGNNAFSLTDDHALTTDGALNAGTAKLALTTVGSNHNLAIQSAITGGIVDLITTGEASEDSAGAITASTELNITANTGIELTSSENNIKNLGLTKLHRVRIKSLCEKCSTIWQSNPVLTFIP